MGLGLAAVIAACSGADEAAADGASSGGSSSGDPAKIAAANASDGVKSGDETDVDCGGSSPNKCAIGKACVDGADCETASCRAGKCAAPAPDDGAKNADETDVDCGGTKAPKCAVGKGCAAHTDCESDACGADKKCAESRSCTGTAGATTCGAAGNESCCTMVPIQAGGASFKIDKFAVTAGRMRAFIERTKGDAKTWITSNKPADWNDAWTAKLPSNMDEAMHTVGPTQKRGCNIEFQGGRTYWHDGFGAEETSDFSKEVLDAKALNCVTWYMAAALCAFDGKRLAKASEIRTVFKNGNANTYPWQFQDNSPYNPSVGDPRLNHQYNYATPNPPANMRKVNGQYPLDHAFYVSPPGAFPKGANKDGVQDIAGNIMSYVLDGPKMFVWTFSWEKHKGDLSTQTWNMSDGPEGYYALGARCATD